MSGRCKCCNAILTEQEMKAKHADTGLYIDLCFFCQAETRLAENGYYDSYYDTPHKFSQFGFKERYKE